MQESSQHAMNLRPKGEKKRGMEANLVKQGLSKDRKQCREGEGEAGEGDHRS